MFIQDRLVELSKKKSYTIIIINIFITVIINIEGFKLFLNLQQQSMLYMKRLIGIYQLTQKL